MQRLDEHRVSRALRVAALVFSTIAGGFTSAPLAARPLAAGAEPVEGQEGDAKDGGAEDVMASVDYELVLRSERVAPTGSSTPVLTINGGIPGPTLRFREGQVARIRVVNALEHEETSIHWHGLLVPNDQDGVPYLTTPPIPPGGSRVYAFPLRQSGTYWYHSHSGLQEQQGVYGAIVIEPLEPAHVSSDRDATVVLSDWTDESPDEVMRTLMRADDWYGQEKGTNQTLLGAWRAGAWGEYWRRERARLPAMDISDVAYDAFLANGERTHRIDAEPGERVRLRFVNAGASTYFYLTSGGGPLRVVAADGIDVEPVDVPRLLMAIAETYDVIVEVPATGAVALRAVAQDGSGAAEVVVGRGEPVRPDDPPPPDLYRMSDTITGAVDAARRAVDREAYDVPRPPAPYNLLRALESTEPPADLPVREIEMRLTGDMTTYRWGFDDMTFAEQQLVGVRAGELVRMVFVNDTMMHHPIHLHGHFFRIVTPNGERSPLKHTVDVAPMARRVIEFIADEPGDWLMHCHLLYHMDAGMTRVVSYDAHDPEHTFEVEPALYGQVHTIFDGTLMTHMSMGMLESMWRDERFGLRWDVQLEDHDGENGHAAERDREVDLYWGHVFDENLRSIAGYRFGTGEGGEDRAFAGVGYRLPYLVWSTTTLDSEGDLRVALAKDLPLTRFTELGLGVRYDTFSDVEGHVDLSWRLTKHLFVVGGWHSDHGFGLGVGLRL